MTTKKPVRAMKNDETIQEYIKDLEKNHDGDLEVPNNEEMNIAIDKIKDIATSFEGKKMSKEDEAKVEKDIINLLDSVPKQTMKKVNFWIEESLIEDIKALQFINGGITLTEAVTFIIKDFFEDFNKTEEYQLYMRLRDKIQKK